MIRVITFMWQFFLFRLVESNEFFVWLIWVLETNWVLAYQNVMFVRIGKMWRVPWVFTTKYLEIYVSPFPQIDYVYTLM